MTALEGRGGGGADHCRAWLTALQTRYSGGISFTDYMRAVAVLQCGNSQEKLELLFSLLDGDRDGLVSRVALLQFTTDKRLLRGCGELVDRETFVKTFLYNSYSSCSTV